MKPKWPACFLSLALMSATSSQALAYTQCRGLVLTEVFADGGNLFVYVGGNMNGYVAATASDYKTIVAIALAAKMSGSPVSIRYQRDGVVCGSAAWNEPITGLGM